MTSEIKVNKISDSCGSALVTKCGSNITLGASGKNIIIACGATTVGMGRSGTVDWCSTIYTNSPGTVTGVSGKGYFLNTTSGAITINLPSSPTVGDIISIKDYANTFDSNSVTVGRGGSKIGGECLDATLGTEGQSVNLIYADATRGWLNVNTDSTIIGATHVAATGGTETTSGDYKIHTFNSSDTFQVTAAGLPSNNKISYVVVAGGGSTGGWAGGGAGAGGFREGKCSSDPYADSPLDSGTAITASIASFPITVGAGGAGKPYPERNSTTKGSDSIFSTITSNGGGVGAPNSTYPSHDSGASAGNGGSGGGGRGCSSGNTGGSGNTPPVSPPQGNNGGTGSPGPAGYFGGGGGGAGAVGTNGSPGGSNDGGPGGAGVASSINGTPTLRAGGGGGGNVATGASTGGPGGGGASAPGGASNGSANTGGGAGGAYAPTPSGTSAGAGGNGGSGVVILRYKYQN
jgi:hypothetical protein